MWMTMESVKLITVSGAMLSGQPANGYEVFCFTSALHGPFHMTLQWFLASVQTFRIPNE